MTQLYYAYDRSGDNLVDDCADLGQFEAENDAEAQEIAAKFWPDLAAAGLLRLA